MLLKFHSAISMNVKDNMKDKLISHIHIILRMYNESRILNDGDKNKFPVLYKNIFFIEFYIECNHILERKKEIND